MPWVFLLAARYAYSVQRMSKVDEEHRMQAETGNEGERNEGIEAPKVVLLILSIAVFSVDEVLEEEDSEEVMDFLDDVEEVALREAINSLGEDASGLDLVFLF